MFTAAPAPQTHYDEQPEQILIVDDDVVCVRALHAVLADLGNVAFTTQASDAVRLAKQLQPNVVLLDISMPERDGYQLCADLKSCVETQDAAVIFITSNDGFEQELKAFEVGAADFLPKPFNPQLVKARVQVQLALRRERRRLLSTQRDLDHVVRNVPGHITFWNSDLMCQLCSDHEGRWFGVPSGGFRGKPAVDVLGEHVARIVRPLLSALLRNAGGDGTVAAEESLALTCVGADGRKRHLHASMALRMDAQNRWGPCCC